MAQQGLDSRAAEVALTTEADAAGAAPGGVQVIARVGQLLRALGAESRGLTLSELAGALSLPRSTVHRLVSALLAEGLVVSFDDGRLRIGPELVRIAVSSRLDLRQQVEPHLRRINEETGETVECAVLEGTLTRVVHVVSTQHLLRAVSDVWSAFPVHCTSKGKALLALLDDDDVRDLLPRSLPRLTPRTTTSLEALLAEIDEVRRTGLAYDLEEFSPGVCAVAIAARDAFGVAYTLSVPVPAQRYPERAEVVAASLLAVRSELTAGRPGADAA